MRSADAARRRVELADARVASDAQRFAAWRHAVLADAGRLSPALLLGSAFVGGALFGRFVGFKRVLALFALARSAPVMYAVAALRARQQPQEQARGG